ncbi:MAG: hypothetical protein HY423_05015 [Candidatus Lambdaproteobacteria bacterium]|nr:hypothetical protein [Candidatus Lambdaproteobacteria bacterium]
MVVRAVRIALLAGLLALPAAAGDAAEPQQTRQGKVLGRIVGDDARGPLVGATVVLLRFQLDEKGNPKGGPIGKQASGASGTYAFTNVPVDERSVFQLGTRIDGKLVSSQPFTFPEGQLEVTYNLTLPEALGPQGGLRIGQALLAVEPAVGRVWITEVLHLENPSAQALDRREQPIALRLPVRADTLEMMRQAPEGRFERVGPKLLLFGRLQPGSNTVAFRYRVGAPLGGLTLDMQYPLPAAEFIVLAPQGSLEVSGNDLQARGTQTVSNSSYDAWGRSGLAAETAMQVQVRGVPMQQAYFLVAVPVFTIALFALAIVFVRRRLKSAQGDSRSAA